MVAASPPPPGGAGNEMEVLRRGTIAPVGNLRIEEAVPPKERNRPAASRARRSSTARTRFLGHAAELGAQVGGATGAGGEAPKILVRQDASEQVWIDVWQDEPTSPDRHYLVKFARETPSVTGSSSAPSTSTTGRWRSWGSTPSRRRDVAGGRAVRSQPLAAPLRRDAPGRSRGAVGTGVDLLARSEATPARASPTNRCSRRCARS